MPEVEEVEEVEELDVCDSCGQKVQSNEGVETFDRASGELLAIICNKCWDAGE